MAGCGDDDDSRAKFVWSAEVDAHFLGLLQGFYREYDTLGKIDTHAWKM